MTASANLSATLAALAHPTRRAIVARLARGEASVNELAKPFAMTQPAISKHLKVLEQAGLISQGQDAQRRPRRFEAAPLRELAEWLEHYRRYWACRTEGADALMEEFRALQRRRRRARRSAQRSSAMSQFAK